MQVVLDTTVLIDYLRGRPVVGRIAELARRGDTLCTTPINVEEVVRGVRRKEQESAGRFFDGLVIAPIGRTEAELAGRWRREFAARGTTLSQADCLIAAVTRSLAGLLVTGNPKHFPMRAVEVEHWRVGE